MTIHYQDDWVTLYQGDYREHLAALAAFHVDALVCDPPYEETSLAWDRWPEGWLDDAAGISANLWCFGSFRMFHEHAAEFAGWRLAQDTIWEKHNGSGFHTDRFRRVHEHAVQSYRGDWSALFNEPPRTPDAVRKTVRRRFKPPHMNQIDNSVYETEVGGDRLMRSVVKLRSMHGRAINETEKPVQLVGLYIGCSVPQGGVVVDLFAGSCSTGQLGRRAILFELREEQCELAARRLARETAMPLDLGATK